MSSNKVEVVQTCRLCGRKWRIMLSPVQYKHYRLAKTKAVPVAEALPDMDEDIRINLVANICPRCR